MRLMDETDNFFAMLKNWIYISGYLILLSSSVGSLLVKEYDLACIEPVGDVLFLVILGWCFMLGVGVPCSRKLQRLCLKDGANWQDGRYMFFSLQVGCIVLILLRINSCLMDSIFERTDFWP